MGTWGVEAFDNDTAGDWAYGLAGEDGLDLVNRTLDQVLETGDEYLDVDEACEGLAACEVVARLKGNWGERNAYTEAADEWVEKYGVTPTVELIENAVAVIDRVRQPPSELLELWEDADAGEWLESLEKLRSRVVG